MSTISPSFTRIALSRNQKHLFGRISCRQKAQMASKASSTSPFVLKPKYADFKKVEASRPLFNPSLPITVTQSPNPFWKYGQPSPPSPPPSKPTDSSSKPPPPPSPSTHTEIDPSTQPLLSNYRLLISAIPRPISFVSTMGKDGTKNLAPFSYFQVIDHSPPTFILGFSARSSRPKDTRRNLLETGECVINIVSEHMIHAVNATSLDIPYAASEWTLSGLTPAASSVVKPERVREAVVSIEGRLLEMKELAFHGKKGDEAGAVAIVEGVRFWVGEGALGERGDEVELERLRPLVQLGGIAYGRVKETFELPRPGLEDELKDGGNGLRDILERER